jgi:hypothetical protein
MASDPAREASMDVPVTLRSTAPVASSAALIRTPSSSARIRWR